MLPPTADAPPAENRCLLGDIEMIDGSSAVAPRFEILGPVRAYRGAEPVDLGPRQRQAVLAVLLLHAGRPVPVHRIVAALWNDDPPENGIDVVLRCVGALRRALDPQRTSLLALTDGGYVLRAGEDAIDAGRFRAALDRARAGHRSGAAVDELRRTLALWQGAPLAGLTGAVFEAARARLTEERAAASELLAEPTRAEPNRAEPTRAEPPPPRTIPAEPVPVRPAYSEPVDPWAGHDLFPPDPLSMA